MVNVSILFLMAVVLLETRPSVTARVISLQATTRSLQMNDEHVAGDPDDDDEASQRSSRAYGDDLSDSSSDLVRDLLIFR